MPQFSVPLGKLAKQLNLESLYAPKDLWQIPITTADINRPGIMLAGFYQYFDATRIQIIGMVEMAYLKDLPDDERRNHLEKLFSMKPPTVIISRGMDPLDEMLDFARWYDVPLMRSAETSSTLMSNLISYLNVELAPRVTRHGVLVEIYGEGILINGDSGIGKSETAIELVKRGHRLIADDAVEIKKVSPHELVGSAPPVLKHYIELRGIGVINVAKLFGMGAVKESSNIDLIINMVPWRDGEAYDRLGMETQYTEILDVKVPSITVPITPGRNLAVIFEVAAMNNRQKRMGYNAAVEFTEQMSKYFTSRNDD